MRRLFSILALLVFGLSISFAQDLTLKDIYTSGKYAQRGIRSVRWMSDGLCYSSLEAAKEVKGRDLVSYNPKTGESKTIISASALIPSGASAPLLIEDYELSSDNTKALIFTNSKRVWRLNTRGDYWVFNLGSGELKKLGQGLEKLVGSYEPSRMMYAKLSPQGDKVGFVYFNNIFVEEISTGVIQQLTFDGSDRIINGNFDWVYEEELHIHDGWRWSPDGKRIAYWQFDTEGTGVFYMINNIDSLYSSIIPFPYPKAGTPNSAARGGVVELATAQTRWIDLPGDPRNHYLARMDFIPNSNEIMIQQLNRLQNTNRLFVVDASTLNMTNILTETDEAFLDIHDNIVWLNGEKYFTWTSEKSGWRHLYKVSRDGKEWTPITKGNFDVMSICRIDPKGGFVYYIASPDSPIDKYLYRSRLDGKGTPEKITPANFVGTHSYNISPSAQYAIHTFQNSTTPPLYELLELRGHRTVKVLEDNAALKEQYASLGLGKKEFFKVNLGVGAELDGWMIKPRDFDPNKKYPVIIYVYGEPWSSTVMNVWSGGELWHQYLAQKGIVIMSLDPQGTNMPKGREWRKSIYGKVGSLGPEDHAKGIQKVLDENPFLDANRVGIWGWSGGGSSTLHAMFKYPNLYKTGIAVAFVSSQNLYDTIYQERYMGLPSTNPEGFKNGSPINFAQNLTGKLMLIHGTGDDNVHYQSCEMLVNKLIEYNKMFQMMSYPMRSHSINERANTSYHLYQTMEKFWMENL